MEIAARKPGRLLWQSTDAEGRPTYEWRAAAPDGSAIEPAACAYTSRRQADLAWREEHPGRAGRPRVDRRPSDGNPKIQVRLDRADYARAEARARQLGHANANAWAREILLQALTD